MLRFKTILVTDAASKFSLAITFKGHPVKSNQQLHQAFSDRGVTFAVLDLTT